MTQYKNLAIFQTLLFFAFFSYFTLDIHLASLFYGLNDTTLFDLFKNITTFGKAEYYLIPSLILFQYYRNHMPLFAKNALFVFSSVALSGIIVNILKVIFGRARPYMHFEQDVSGFSWFNFESHYLSFPSGHSAVALSAWLALGMLFPKYKNYLLLVGILIAVSRMITSVHYLSDIIIGSTVGVMTTIILYYKFFVYKKR